MIYCYDFDLFNEKKTKCLEVYHIERAPVDACD